MRIIGALRVVTIAGALAFLAFHLADIDPSADLTEAHRAYGRGDYDQAMRLARRAFLLSEGKERAHASIVVAMSAKRRNNDTVALKYLDRAVSANPECGRCYLARANILSSMGKYREAVEDYDRGFRFIHSLPKNMAAKYLSRRGIARIRLGKVEEGCSDAFRALDLDGSSALAHFSASLCYYGRKDMKRAKEEAETGYRLGSEIPYFFSDEKYERGEEWMRYLSKIRLESERSFDR
jgi:tetratricopeptide (TPR) repeat protein